MSLNVDLETKRIVASVRDLIRDPSSRTIGLAGDGLARLAIGGELHRRVQDEMISADQELEAERSFSQVLEIDGWSLELRGRADLVWAPQAQIERIDEIKTMSFAMELSKLFHEELLDRHRTQVRLYGFLASLDQEIEPELRLILVDLTSSERRIETVAWTASSVHSWLRQAVHRLIHHAKRMHALAADRRNLAKELPFPYESPRGAQLPILDEVAEALEANKDVLLAAPTGTGKTAAVLWPALRHALATGKRVVYLTAKTLQQKMAMETVESIAAKAPTALRSLQLRAKSKMCANTEIICHPDFCPFAQEYGRKLSRHGVLEQILREGSHSSPDKLFATGRGFEVCPFELSLDLIDSMDVVVCDYNYVFDPLIGLDALIADGSTEAILIIDEAHNLVERSRGYYSPEIGDRHVERARELLASLEGRVFRRLEALIDRIEVFLTEQVEEGLEGRFGEVTVLFDPEPIADLRLDFDSALLEYFMVKRELDLWVADDPVMELYLQLVWFHKVLGFGGDEFRHIVRKNRNGRAMQILCLDASRFLREVIERAGGVIAMSATLEPFEFYEELLGFDPERRQTLSHPSPFPAENRLVVAVDEIDTTWKKRESYHDRVAGWIARISPPGRSTLALFPSYAYLRAVADRLPAIGQSLFIQQPGSSDFAQRELLSALASGEPHLVLAVLGGVFAEGVDYPGNMLSAVIVVSPGLPQHNFERQLLKAYYQHRYGHGFSYAYLVPGLRRVVQAAGRLIRSETDRGIIALLGQRFNRRQYRALLPEDWRDHEGRIGNDRVEERIQSFFDGVLVS